MECSPSNTQFDIFDVYRRFSDIRSREAYICGEGIKSLEEESERASLMRHVAVRLLTSLEARLPSEGISIFDELRKLMSYINLLIDFSEFSCFYDFVFFVCREKGQRTIPVSKAITAWKLVLSGRFQLLNQWCDFVEKIGCSSISKDLWRQVLRFSHRSLEGYDPEDAWPVMIDDFVLHMNRISGSNNSTRFCCARDNDDKPSSSLPGLKRKFSYHDCEQVVADLSDMHI